MATPRHARPPELEGLSLEEIMQTHVGRFSEKHADWAAFEDAKTEGHRRAQHRFIGAGGSDFGRLDFGRLDLGRLDLGGLALGSWDLGIMGWGFRALGHALRRRLCRSRRPLSRGPDS